MRVLRIDYSIEKVLMAYIIKDQYTELALLDHIPSGVVIFNSSGIIIYANDQAAHILRISNDQILGLNYNSPEWITKDYDGNRIPDQELPFSQATEGGRAVHDAEQSFELANGKTIYLSVYASLIKIKGEQAESVLIHFTDVTSSVFNQKELQKSEERYKNLFNNLLDEVHVWKYVENKEGELINWELSEANPVALKNWGKTLAEVEGKKVTEIFGKEAIMAFKPIIEKIRSTGKAIRWEYYFSPTDQYLSMDSIPFGEYFISTGRDISDIKEYQRELIAAKEKAEKAEIEARKDKDRYQGLLSNLETGVVIHARDASVIASNKRSAEILGITEEDWRGKGSQDSDWQFFYKDGTPMPTLDQPVMRVINTKSAIRNQVVGILKPGEEIIWLEVNGFPVLNEYGDIIEVTISFIDITKRKLIEENMLRTMEHIEDSEKRLLLATESARLGVWDWDIDANILSWDDRMFELYGKDRNTAEDTLELWSNGLHPDDKERLLKDLDDAINGKSEFDHTFRVLHPDGEVRYVKGDGLILRNREDKALRMIGVNRDITDSKLKELELEKNIVEKELLLKEVHHRVKNNLALISAMLYLQEKEHNNSDFSDLIMDTQSKIMSIASVHELIYQNESFSEIRVDQYIRKIHEQLKSMYPRESKSITYSTKLDPIKLIIEQAIPLALIINEVLTNTLKHAFDDDMDGSIEIILKEHMGTVNLEIMDNGKGLPEDFIIEDSDSLGFTLIKQFTKQLEGTFELRNTEPVGTSFSMSFGKSEQYYKRK